MGNIVAQTYNLANDIAATQRDLQFGNLSAKDKATANSHLKSLLANSKEMGGGGATPTATGAVDPTTTSDYYKPSGSASDENVAEKVTGDGSMGSPLGWVKEQIGNVGFVVAGIAVLAIALVLGAKGVVKS